MTGDVYCARCGKRLAAEEPRLYVPTRVVDSEGNVSGVAIHAGCVSSSAVVEAALLGVVIGAGVLLAYDRNSVIAANMPAGQVAFIADYAAAAGEPGWGQHCATLQLKASPEWQAWTAANKKSMSQEEFAVHLQDNAPDVIEPTGAALFEMVRTLEATSAGTCTTAINLGNGERQFVWTEEVREKVGGTTDMRLPREIALKLRPWLGFDPWRVEAFLRYRLSAGRLTLSYELKRPHVVVEAAGQDVVDRITAHVAALAADRGDFQPLVFCGTAKVGEAPSWAHRNTTPPAGVASEG